MLKASNQLMINLNKLWIKRNTWSVVQFLLPTRTEIESHNIEFGKSQIDEILCNKQEIWKEHECFHSNWKINSPTQNFQIIPFPLIEKQTPLNIQKIHYISLRSNKSFDHVISLENRKIFQLCLHSIEKLPQKKCLRKPSQNFNVIKRNYNVII